MQYSLQQALLREVSLLSSPSDEEPAAAAAFADEGKALLSGGDALTGVCAVELVYAPRCTLLVPFDGVSPSICMAAACALHLAECSLQLCCELARFSVSCMCVQLHGSLDQLQMM